MNDQLRNMLIDRLKSGWQSNPGMSALVHDYARYHAVLVIAGGLLVVVFVLLSVFSWISFKKIPKAGRFRWASRKQVYFSFGILSTIVSFFVLLVVAANATNAFNPLPGFSSLVSSSAIRSDSAVGDALNGWITSGSGKIPPVIEQRIHDRIAWQEPKAVVCGIGLIALVALSVFLWRMLIKAMEPVGPKRRLKKVVLSTAGSAAVAIALLLMVMTVANLQGAIAPMTISILGANG